MKLNITEVRLQMARLGLNTMELSRRASVSRQTLSMLMHGKDCSAITLGRIAKALGVDPADILDV